MENTNIVFGVYAYANLSASAGFASKGVRLVCGENPKPVDAMDEAISVANWHIVRSLNVKVGAV